MSVVLLGWPVGGRTFRPSGKHAPPAFHCGHSNQAERSKTIWPPTSVVSTRPGTSSPTNGVFLPWLLSAAGSTVQNASGSKMQTSAALPTARCPGVDAENRSRMRGDARERLRATQSVFGAAHLSVSGSRSSRPVAPGSASPNGTCFASSSTGVWSEQTTSIVPSASPATQRVAVARAAQRRHETALRVELADVDVAQVKVVHGDVARDRQAFLFGGTHEATPSALDRRARCTRAPVLAHERDDRRAARSFPPPPESAAIPGVSRPRRRARRRLRARSASCGRSQTVIAERRRVLHRAKQHLRVRERRVPLREARCTPLRRARPSRSGSRPQTYGERADRMDMRLVERARAVLQHLDEARARQAADRYRAGTRDRSPHPRRRRASRIRASPCTRSRARAGARRGRSSPGAR